MLKLLVPLAALLLMSGCCRMLGICTSASVHTSIASPEEFAQQDNNWQCSVVTAQALPER
jgi:uncharacterized protein YceK